ncbi:Exopolyphosphatase [Fulvivirga imtechensis AK7]|uniref:Exopolyphosphatase n=1 Tax=Fulvivirga imtechensis AK7 TaxID=1237149 RepID=L8JUL1_9BACT|nr:exopolyphosphatase [Fulvivirga imtechensis]ELR72691.1 Exopolyphosphatase [Fulvivirga imtechensis AK7]
MAKDIAIIDCGTNTFHLLIAAHDDSNLNILHREKVAVRIGRGGISSKVIVPDAIERAVNTIHHFAEVISKNNVSGTYAFATSAFRNATNGEEVKQIIKSRTGIDIRIIDGNKEAELIFWGVNAALDIGDQPVLIMDIGGGSVEFIIGSANHILWKGSFEIGAQRLLDMFHKNDPIKKEEIKALEKYLSTSLQSLFEQLNAYQPQTLIGSSGTFDTLSDIYCAKEHITTGEHTTEVPLSIEGYHLIHSELITKTKDERLAIPGMLEMRVDMIVVASCLIKLLLDMHPFKNLRVSTQALKEGVLDRILHGHFS